MLYIITIVLIYLVTFSLAWCSPFMNLLEEGPWYISLIYLSRSVFIIPLLLLAIIGIIFLICVGFINFLFEAWKDFTVDVEQVDLPV